MIAHALTRVNVERVVALAAATALFAFGFFVDGISEVGHHAGFIVGGIALGRALFRR
jgi:hypothetical protein